MKLNIALAAAAVAATLGITLLLDRAPPPRAVNVGPVEIPAPADRAGQSAPDAALALLDGTAARLHDYKGDVVVLNFWASWCVPCAVEYPQMVRLARALPDVLTIVAVSVDEDRAAITRFIERFGAPPPNFIIAHDPQKNISQDLYQTLRLPESYIIAPGMIMRDKVIGASVTWDDAAMMERLKGYALAPRKRAIQQ